MKKNRSKGKGKYKNYQILIDKTSLSTAQQKIKELFKDKYSFEYFNDSLQGAYILALWKVKKNNVTSFYRFILPYNLAFKLQGRKVKRWRRAEEYTRKRETQSFKDWILAISKVLRKKSTFVERTFDISQLSDVYSIFDDNVNIANINIPSKNNSHYEEVVRKSRQKKIDKTRNATFTNHLDDFIILITEGKLNVNRRRDRKSKKRSRAN